MHQKFMNTCRYTVCWHSVLSGLSSLQIFKDGFYFVNILFIVVKHLFFQLRKIWCIVLPVKKWAIHLILNRHDSIPFIFCVVPWTHICLIALLWVKNLKISNFLKCSQLISFNLYSLVHIKILTFVGKKHILNSATSIIKYIFTILSFPITVFTVKLWF